MAATKVVVGRADALADGERMTVQIAGRLVVIFRQKGRFYGLLNRCPHRGADLCKGRFMANITSETVGEYVFHGEDRLLACPWHGWEFDITTGQSFFDPQGVRARPYPVEVASGDDVITELESGQASYTPAEFAAASGASGDGMQPGPYQAETYDVSVEDDYIVVSTRPARPPRRAGAVRRTGRELVNDDLTA